MSGRLVSTALAITLTERYDLQPELDLAARDARDLQEVVDQADHVVDLPLHDLERRVERVRRTSASASICSELRIGASGLRSSCASVARNSSLRRSASAASRLRLRDADVARDIGMHRRPGHPRRAAARLMIETSPPCGSDSRSGRVGRPSAPELREKSGSPSRRGPTPDRRWIDSSRPLPAELEARRARRPVDVMTGRRDQKATLLIIPSSETRRGAPASRPALAHRAQDLRGRITRRGPLSSRATAAHTLRRFLHPAQIGTDLVLPLPRAQRRPHPADQRGDPDRALEQRHVSEIVDRLERRRRVGAVMSQDQQREIGPRRLISQKRDQPSALGIGDRLFRQQNRAGPGTDRAAQRVMSAQVVPSGRPPCRARPGSGPHLGRSGRG